jgi:hypothetical protein
MASLQTNDDECPQVDGGADEFVDIDLTSTNKRIQQLSYNGVSSSKWMWPMKVFTLLGMVGASVLIVILFVKKEKEGRVINIVFATITLIIAFFTILFF